MTTLDLTPWKLPTVRRRPATPIGRYLHRGRRRAAVTEQDRQDRIAVTAVLCVALACAAALSAVTAAF